MVYKKTGSNNWSYKFQWRGAPINLSTKQSNKRVAEQMEAAHRTRLAKGGAGLIDKPPAPTVAEFAPRFLSYVCEKHSAKPKTVVFYTAQTAVLLNSCLKDLPLDTITTEQQTIFTGGLRARHYAISTINRSLATLRRMMHLLEEWDAIICRKVKLLPGENKRDFVLTPEQEAAYLAVAEPLLHSIAIVILDCGLRPEELHRLRWDQYRDRSLTIFTGKGTGSRRRVEVTARAAKVLDVLFRTSEFVFPAPTVTGHIDASSYKKQHAKAVKAAGLPHFVPYSLRHTAITNLAITGIDAPALMYWAGHKNLATTMGYIHLAADAIQRRIRDARESPRFGVVPVIEPVDVLPEGQQTARIA